MAPDRLKIAKMEFQHMLDLGHMRPSSSNYSSPLHMVPKKESNDWRPHLNAVCLCNAASTFQRFIDEVTRGLKGVYAFIDDILIASQNVQEHTTNLRTLFERLDYYGLTIKPSKCTFGVSSLKFLGFQVSSEGISPLPDRVDAIQKFPRPNTLTQLRRFLGMSHKKPSRPSKNPQTPLEWTEEAENSFTAAKTALANETLLKHPIPGSTLSVWTDASNFAIGSSLMQHSNSNLEPIAFLSLKLFKTEQNWSTYDRELWQYILQ
ncbi:retrovirus-related Pol polyprotein from transposon opus [Trichonephila clavipes]|nr:retrovirus-related Pol polyprotein from transposon opus [Trichonephila clavipes]